MSDNTLVEDTVTDTSDASGNQAQAAKSYTQQEVDNMMARMRGSMEKKFSRTFEDLGDIEELRQLKTEAEKRKQEAQLKRGEFEKTLQEQAAKYGQEIQKRDKIIQDYKLNMPLLNAAAKFKAVNPEQVQTLLRNNLRLNEDGEAEVIDSKGAVRYTEQGNLLSVEDYVEDWLRSNSHFVTAAPATVNTKSNIKPGSNGKIDLKDLDLTRPQDRQIYAEARQKGLI